MEVCNQMLPCPIALPTPEPSVATGAAQGLTAGNQINRKLIRDTATLFDAPFTNAPKKRLLLAGESLEVLAYHEGFANVRSSNEEGWIPLTSIK